LPKSRRREWRDTQGHNCISCSPNWDVFFRTAMAIIMKCRNRFCKEKVRIRKDSGELRAWCQEVELLFFWQSETPFSYSAHVASTTLGNAPYLQVEITLFHQFLGVHTNTYLTENDKRMFARGPFGEDSIIVQCSIKFASSPWLRWWATAACKFSPGIQRKTLCLWTQCKWHGWSLQDWPFWIWSQVGLHLVLLTLIMRHLSIDESE
jgi:hypothetical protein